MKLLHAFVGKGGRGIFVAHKEVTNESLERQRQALETLLRLFVGKGGKKNHE